MAIRLAILLAVFPLVLMAGDFNEVVLRQVRAMPGGGGYATTSAAHGALASSVLVDAAGVRIRAEAACPSYCSGATYLVFLKTLGELQKSGVIQIPRAQWQALLPASLADGQGVCGRWNANGPGTPRLFHELHLGKNFTSPDEARPGDFLKIFWSDSVGRDERGHSVVFLGMETRDGIEYLRFWSSNKPAGYGEKSVRRSQIAHTLFSRLEFPQNAANAAALPARDAYLADLLSQKSSFAEAKQMSGAQ